MKPALSRSLLILLFVVLSIVEIRGQDLAPTLKQNHPILYAAQMGNVDEVVGLLSGEVTVNSCTDYGYTAIRQALRFGKLDVARELMRRGFNPTLTYKSAFNGEFVEIGRAPLSLAVKAGAGDIIDELLGRGIAAYPESYGEEHDPDLVDPILAAIQRNWGKMLRKLLRSVSREVAIAKVKEKSYAYLAACT